MWQQCTECDHADTDQRLHLMFQSEWREKCDFNPGMIVDTIIIDQYFAADLLISKCLINKGAPLTMLGLIQLDIGAAVPQITPLYNRGEQKSILKHTTPQTFICGSGTTDNVGFCSCQSRTGSWIWRLKKNLSIFFPVYTWPFQMSLAAAASHSDVTHLSVFWDVFMLLVVVKWGYLS